MSAAPTYADSRHQRRRIVRATKKVPAAISYHVVSRLRQLQSSGGACANSRSQAPPPSCVHIFWPHAVALARAHDTSRFSTAVAARDARAHCARDKAAACHSLVVVHVGGARCVAGLSLP